MSPARPWPWQRPRRRTRGDAMTIYTYPAMNEKIVELLRLSGEAMQLYAAQRSEELEAEIRAIKSARPDGVKP